MGKEKNIKEDEIPIINMNKENFQYFEADRLVTQESISIALILET